MKNLLHFLKMVCTATNKRPPSRSENLISAWGSLSNKYGIITLCIFLLKMQVYNKFVELLMAKRNENTTVNP